MILKFVHLINFFAWNFKSNNWVYLKIFLCAYFLSNLSVWRKKIDDWFSFKEIFPKYFFCSGSLGCWNERLGEKLNFIRLFLMSELNSIGKIGTARLSSINLILGVGYIQLTRTQKVIHYIFTYQEI